jgi:hypothetical protein
VKSEFPDHFTREEKEVFQRKVAPYNLIKGILFKLGTDEQLRRCLEGTVGARILIFCGFNPKTIPELGKL